MKIVGMLRVKNEARWIGRVLQSLAPVCGDIVVFDDHSTDETPAICAAAGARVIRSPFWGLDEARDKNYLLRQAAECAPDWIVHVDGDEELAPGGAAAIRVSAMQPGSWSAFRFRVLYLWDAPDQVRTDGVYASFRRPSLFRYRSDLRFAGTANGGNFHCGNVPSGLRVADCGAALLHYGYMDRVDRLRKYEWYNAQDPHNRAEDGYRHMVIGDVFPANSKFEYAGPLRVESLCTHLSAD